ncbi:MAG: DUF421 domain-containing protein [Firmicutes bacterium]|nr:DUF421 domain-containing protein [Bacillota bacterium]
MITVLVRATILFFMAVLMMRIMGKRQISQLQPYELVIAIMIAELAATPMEDISLPLLYGIVPMLTLMMLHSALSIASLKSQRLRALISGTPSILIKKGVVQEDELRRNCFDLNDLLEEVRAGGIENPADVCTAILETSGKMSVFPHAQKRPLSPEDMGLSVSYEGIPLTLVLDGDIQHQNLTVGGLDVNWLNKTLEGLGFHGPAEVFLASLDTQGMLFAQGRGNKPRMKIARVLNAEKVGW